MRQAKIGKVVWANLDLDEPRPAFLGASIGREHGHFTDTLHQNAAMAFFVVSANFLFSKGKVARPERFELPTFWFVGGIFALQQTTPAYKSQRNQQKQSCAFGWFRLALYPVHVHLHGHLRGHFGNPRTNNYRARSNQMITASYTQRTVMMTVRAFSRKIALGASMDFPSGREAGVQNWSTTLPNDHAGRIVKRPVAI